MKKFVIVSAIAGAVAAGVAVVANRLMNRDDDVWTDATTGSDDVWPSVTDESPRA